VDERHDSFITEKRTYDAFHLTPLQGLLERRGVRAVIVGGVMTELCCETTARAAFCRGFDVFFLADGTGTDAASHHRATLRALEFGFATVVEVAEAVDAIKAVAAASDKGVL
jgi:nicotinamidase-related amidase